MSATEISMYLADEQATVKLGELLGQQAARLASTSDHGAVIFLQGDLGAGKTTMSRGVLRAFGHSGAVKSPTYTLVEPYEFETTRVFHFDLYRLGDAEELEYMGIRDYFNAGNVCLIEWPARGEGVLPSPNLVITVKTQAPGRQVHVKAIDGLGLQLIAAIKSL